MLHGARGQVPTSRPAPALTCCCHAYHTHERTTHRQEERLEKEIVVAKDSEIEARLEQIRAAHEAHKKAHQQQVGLQQGKA